MIIASQVSLLKAQYLDSRKQLQMLFSNNR